MKTHEFDEKFESGDNITAALDMSEARRPYDAAGRVNVDFPAWAIDGLDREARRLGVTRQSLIKIWIADRISR